MAYIVEIIGIIAGLGAIGMGLGKYGWWDRISIGGGFMPTIVGTLLVLFCVLMLISKVRRKEKAEKMNLKVLLPIGAMLLILLCNYLLGLLPACILVSFLWLLLIEKYSWKKALLVSAIMFVCVYGIFRLWLNVPFPKGLLNISL